MSVLFTLYYKILENFSKPCFFNQIGIEYRESNLILNEKNNQVLVPGMVFNIILGFGDLELSTKKGKGSNTYAMVIADTVAVGENGVSVLTSNDIEWGDVSYSLDDEPPAEGEKALEAVSNKVIEEIATVNSSRRRERTNAVDQKTMEELERRNHQKALAERQLQERINKYSNTPANNQSEGVAVVQSDLNTYEGPTEYPDDTAQYGVSKQTDFTILQSMLYH